MKKSEVKVGEVYSVKVSGRIAAVRIDRENPHGGWDGTNLKTKKAVRIKSAQRLRGKAANWPGKKARGGAKQDAEKEREQASAERAAQQVRKDIAKTVKAVRSGDLTKGVTVPTAKKKRPAKAEKTEKKKRKPSGLDAAAQVLAEAKEPMSTKEMVAEMLAKGLWRTSGKTPAATIYAAIIREIATKGDAARFRKVERGKFELAR